MAPALFLAGWYYNLAFNVGESNYIKVCYEPNEDLTNTLYDAMEAYIDGDSQTGDAKMAAAKDLYPAALAKCTEYDV